MSRTPHTIFGNAGGGAPASGSGEPDTSGFTRLDGRSFRETLVQDFGPLANDLRDMIVEFGAREYAVRIVATKWTGGRRGAGQEIVTRAIDVLPTPKISGMSAMDEPVENIGRTEVGKITVSKINPDFTEDQLRGLGPGGVALDADETVRWEIEFFDRSGSAQKRSFVLSGAPEYHFLSWTVTLERTADERDRNGELLS